MVSRLKIVGVLCRAFALMTREKLAPSPITRVEYGTRRLAFGPCSLNDLGRVGNTAVEHGPSSVPAHELQLA